MKKYRFVHPRAMPTRQSESAVGFKAGAVIGHEDLHDGHRASLLRQGVLVEIPEEESAVAQTSAPTMLETDNNGMILDEGMIDTEHLGSTTAEGDGEDLDAEPDDVEQPEEKPKPKARRSRKAAIEE